MGENHGQFTREPGWPARRERGYSLIQVSILVIVGGLLLSGSMAVRDMLRSAQLTHLAEEFNAIRAATNAYQERFRAMPGDDPQAAIRHSGARVAPGAGNGVIDGDWDSVKADHESFLFWQHVRLAGLLAGPVDVEAPDYQPRNHDHGVIGVNSATPSQKQVAGLPGLVQACSKNVPGRLAKQLDARLDDGDTATGAVRVVPDGAPLGAPAVSTAQVSDGRPYTVCLAF